MKRFCIFITTFSLIDWIGRHPALAAGVLTLLGVGGVGGIANLITPSITPQPAAYFNQSNATGLVNVGLTSPSGAFFPPTTTTNSYSVLFSGAVNTRLGYFNSGAETPFIGMSLTDNTSPGAPKFSFQHTVAGGGGTQWFNSTGPASISSGVALSGTQSNYNTGGIYTGSPSGTNCVRPPTVAWLPGTATVQLTDPGFNCPVTLANFDPVNMPGSGAQQSTGAGSISTTCSSNSPVSTEMAVTTHVAIAHGITEGQKFTLSAFTPSALNLTYTALPGTSGTTLVGAATISGGTCPSLSGLVEGKALSGTGAAFVFPAISLTGPFVTGETGITTHNGQHFCGILDQYGDNSPTPGFQAVSMVDEKGNPLNGAPALSTIPNVGTANVTGYVVAGTQSSGNPALNVTALNPYVIDSATYDATTGYVTFNLDASSGSPGFVTGSEFTVSGMNATGQSVNLPYIAVAGTSGLTVKGNPLTAVNGPANPFTTGPGTITTGGSPQLVSNIVPGMQVLGAPIASYVLPFGSYGGTPGSGGIGQYGLNANQPGGQTISVTSIANGPGSVTMVVGGSTPSPLLVVGDTINIAGYASPVVITGIGTTAGGLGSYTVNNPNTSGALTSVTGTMSGAIGSSGSPVNIFLSARTYYQTVTPNTTPSGGAVVVRTQAQFGDLVTLFGSSSTLVTGTNRIGWGGELADIAMLYTPGGFPTQSGGAPSTTALASLCTKQQDIQDFANANNFVVENLYRLNDVGTFGDSSNATVTGYITNSGTNATLNIVGLPVHGSLVVASTQTAHLSGAGITAAASTTITLTASASPTYTITPNTTPAVGSIGSPVTFSIGRWAPMTPLTSGSVIGYIDMGGGSTPTLHVTDLPTGTSAAKFTASYDGANNLTVSGTPTGTVSANMLVTDGGLNITGQPLLIKSGTGPFVVSPNYYLAFGTDSQMIGTITTLVPGSYVFNSSATTPITNPVKIVGYQGACGITGNAVYNGAMGCYTLSGSPNAGGTVGSSGAGSVTFTTTSIQDGGAVAPGPALTIRDQGPGVVFSVDQSTISCSALGSCAGTGALALSGAYDISTLGGTPSGIQVLVSTSPNGAPLAGCTPCNWGALTATIGAGKWSGTIAGIPGGGPYYVFVRATNGQSYATLPNSVSVGLPFGFWGNGQVQSVTTGGGINVTSFAGNWGFVNPQSAFSPTLQESFLAGPPVVPNFTPAAAVSSSGDRFGILGTTFSPQIPNESITEFEQMLTNAFGWPTTVLNIARDGVGITPSATGNVVQTQTVGLGTGTLTTWCSSATFCSNTDHNEALTFNMAALTGAWFNGTVANVSGTWELSINTWLGGALEPGMTLSAGGSATFSYCLSGCTGDNHASVWVLSGSPSAFTGVMRADPAGGAPWPNFDLQGNGLAFGDSPIVKAGTFKISVNGTTVCQDNQTFAYNQTGGNCTGAGITSSFVNYQTGDYQVTFSSPPTGPIVATWTSITSPGGSVGQFFRAQNLDLFGDGTCDSGYISSMFCKTPGGVIGQFNGNGSDADYINQFNSPQAGYQYGAVGYGQEMSGLYDSIFPARVPGAKSTVPFFSIGYIRGEGPITFTSGSAQRQLGTDQYSTDAAMKSTLAGTIGASGGSASAVLTLNVNSVGPLWEGEILQGANLPQGVYVTGLCTTALCGSASPAGWGLSTSTYALAGASGVSIPVVQAFSNAVYYSGPGPAIYAGPLNDIYPADMMSITSTVTYAPHPGTGFTGIRRIASRWAAEAWGGLTNLAGAVFPPNASPPTLSRAAQTACGSKPSPCFDTTNSYTAVVTPTSASGNVLTMPGLSAHARPVVMGQTVSCGGCGAGFVVTAVSNPPTQSIVALQGQIGSSNNGWTVTVSGSGTLGWTSGAVTFGCAADACIDIAVQQNTTNGTYGTAWALDNCGANNINGSAANYHTPTGKCQGGGKGDLVRSFRIGPTQAMFSSNGSATFDVFDDGIDYFGGAFHMDRAFTCNIVDTAIVQCVKGTGAWTSGATFMSYGDAVVATGRVASLLGYLGGQSFPITNGGTGYLPANATTTETLNCGTPAATGYQPKVDIVTTGGVITGVFPSSSTTPNPPMGLGLGSACTVPLTGITGGTGASIPNIQLAPPEGVGGIATVNTDNNMMGMFIYDNSGEPGNPLNMFFTNGMGGYWEPGLPLRTFGEFQGAAVAG